MIAGWELSVAAEQASVESHHIACFPTKGGDARAPITVPRSCSHSCSYSHVGSLRPHPQPLRKYTSRRKQQARLASQLHTHVPPPTAPLAAPSTYVPNQFPFSPRQDSAADDAFPNSAASVRDRRPTRSTLARVSRQTTHPPTPRLFLQSPRRIFDAKSLR